MLFFISSFCVISPALLTVCCLSISSVYNLCASWCLCQFVLCHSPEPVPVSSCVCGMFPGFCSRLYFITFITGLNFAFGLCLVGTFVLLLCIWLLGLYDFQLFIKAAFLFSILRASWVSCIWILTFCHNLTSIVGICCFSFFYKTENWKCLGFGQTSHLLYNKYRNG